MHTFSLVFPIKGGKNSNSSDIIYSQHFFSLYHLITYEQPKKKIKQEREREKFIRSQIGSW